MLTIILKDLRSYTNNRKYLTIQFIVLTVFVVLFFIAAVEFYAQGINTQQNRMLVDVGTQTYTLLIVCIFMAQFLIPKHAVESVYMERSKMTSEGHQHRCSVNTALLALTPLANWKILCGKLAAVVIWGLWGLWLTIPLFTLSSYIGGLPISQLGRCGAVIFVSCPLFALIGIGFASRQPPEQAKGISYGIILAITFLPMVPISPFMDIPMLAALSPLSVLLSILQSHTTHLWIWHLGLYCGLSLLMLPILIRIYR